MSRTTIGGRDPANGRPIAVDIEDSWPGHLVPSRVSLQTTSGRSVSRLVDTLPGSPDNPLSDADLFDKFADCVSRAVRPIAADDARKFAGRISRLEALPDIRDLWL